MRVCWRQLNLQLKQKISIQNIYVVILLILIGMAGLLTYSQSKTKNELVESASKKNDSAGNRKNVKPNSPLKKSPIHTKDSRLIG